eukprot:6175507-Pleurochrysis_carterae.AAC.2
MSCEGAMRWQGRVDKNVPNSKKENRECEQLRKEGRQGRVGEIRRRPRQLPQEEQATLVGSSRECGSEVCA